MRTAGGSEAAGRLCGPFGNVPDVKRCPYCAEEIQDDAVKCRFCGSFLSPPGKPKRLFRSRRDRKLAGIAGGMAEYMAIDPTIVRLLWVLAAFFSVGVIVLLYLILIFVIPNEDESPPPA